MYIDNEKKYIFFHTPKTGGNSIISMLLGDRKNRMETILCLLKRRGVSVSYVGNMPHVGGRKAVHLTYSDLIRYIDGGEWLSYYKFCFTRHPRTHFYSLYRQLVSVIKNPPSFKEWAKSYRGDPQCSRFTHHKGCQVMDFIGKQETFSSSAQELCDILKIEYRDVWKNRRTEGIDIDAEYDAETELIMQRLYKSDFKLFDYKMRDADERRAE